MDIDLRRKSFPKPSTYKLSPVSARSSRPITIIRTKKLANSYLGTPITRYHTQPFQLEEEQYISNQKDIRKLKEYLNKQLQRKRDISNPEYSISLEDDILDWSNSVSVLKEEISILKKENSQRMKKAVPDQKKEKELMCNIQKQIRRINKMMDEMVDGQKQIDFLQEKNEQKEREIQELQNEEVQTAYLKRLKQIQMLQHSSSSQIKKLSQKYLSTQKQVQTLQQTITGYQSTICRYQKEIIDSIETFNQLLLEYYADDFQYQDSQL